MDEIHNDELVIEQIPDPDADWDTIQRFALTFDGYRFWGSFEKCAEVANKHLNSTLTELRTCLFFEQRRWRHFDEEPDYKAMVYLGGIIKKIREAVSRK